MTSDWREWREHTPKLIARLGHANGFQRAAYRRCREPGGRHQLTKEKPSLGVCDRRLHANPDETIGVIHWLPRVNGQLAAPVVGVPVIPDIQLGAVVHEELHDGRPPLVSGAVQ